MTLRSLAPALALLALAAHAQTPGFQLTDAGYFERGGVSVMAFQDFYPDGHQGGITLVQHGIRIAANGDLRLNATPGQWDPVPKQDSREVVGGARQSMSCVRTKARRLQQ